MLKNSTIEKIKNALHNLAQISPQQGFEVKALLFTIEAEEGEDDLQSKIMGIQTSLTQIDKAKTLAKESYKELDDQLTLAYKYGHRDARHDAAEVVMREGED
jgi:hypothetical protein